MPEFKKNDEIKPILIKASQKVKGKLIIGADKKLNLQKDVKEYFQAHFKNVIEEVQGPLRGEID